MFGEESVPKIFQGDRIYVSVDNKSYNVDPPYSDIFAGHVWWGECAQDIPGGQNLRLGGQQAGQRRPLGAEGAVFNLITSFLRKC